MLVFFYHIPLQVGEHFKSLYKMLWYVVFDNVYYVSNVNAWICRFDMGSLAVETDNIVCSDVYLSLGLKELGKGVMKIPRVLSLLSSLLEKSVQRNEMQLEATQVKDVLTIFHGLRAPSLSIRQYVDRIFKYSGCSPSCFVVANIYVDRFLQSTDIHLTSLNVHRLLITSVMLAVKFMDDA